MTMDPLRIGLIGCGRAAERIYLPAFGRIATGRLAAVADPSRERRELVGAVMDVPDFESAGDMLAACELDAVIVATPPETHADLASAALARSLAVLVEKPLAPSLADARRLADAAAAANRPVMVGFNRRRLPAAERLRAALATVDGGSIRIDSEFHALPAVWDPVAGARDPLDDLASHHLDLFRFLTGSDIASVDAGRLDGGGIELRLDLESGARGRCTVSQGASSREDVTVSLVGPTKGPGRLQWRLRPSSDRLTPASGAGRAALDRGAKLVRRLRGRPDPMARSFASQLEVFVAAALGIVLPSPGIEDGLAVVRAVEAARARLEDRAPATGTRS